MYVCMYLSPLIYCKNDSIDCLHLLYMEDFEPQDSNGRGQNFLGVLMSKITLEKYAIGELLATPIPF